MNGTRTCSMHECDQPQKTRGYCSLHYQRLWKAGALPRRKPGRITTLEQSAEWFWTRVDKSGECWIFLGSTDKDGYGVFTSNHKGYRAHRFSMMLHGVSVPEGMVARHLCNVRACVNPSHLTVGTQAENVKDAIEAGTFNPRRTTPEEESAIKAAFLAKRSSVVEFLEETGMSRTHLYRIVRRAA